MEKDYKDFHIDNRLEKLFHGDDPKFNSENGDGDQIMAESLPEWLIGVIVIIVLLVIAFFIMVISTIIKNKRKSQSASTSDLSSTTHICDDMELGKISMVDPRHPVSSPESEETNKSDFLSRSQNAQPEPCCSSTGNDSPMCTYKNPLFIDDDPEQETDHDVKCDPTGNTKTDNLNTQTCGKSKGNYNKHKSSKSIACNDLNIVQEMKEEEKENLDEDCNQQISGTENDSVFVGPDQGNTNPNTNSIPQFPNTDCNTDKVLVHAPGDVTNSSQNKNLSADNDHPEERAVGSVEIETNDDTENVGAENVETEDCQSSDENNPNDCDHVDEQTSRAGSDVVDESTTGCTKEDTKLVDTESHEQTKSQRFSFIRMTLDEDGSELENNERTYTKL